MLLDLFDWGGGSFSIIISYIWCVDYCWAQYNIKKKEEAPEAETQKEPDNPLMRKKKTPEELAKEAEEADQDELTSKYIFFFF